MNRVRDALAAAVGLALKYKDVELQNKLAEALAAATVIQTELLKLRKENARLRELADHRMKSS